MLFHNHFFLGPRLLGSGQFSCDHRPHSLAYFCSTCGEVWGRIMVEGPGGQYWDTQRVPCEKHSRSGVPDWAAIPGAFLSGGPVSKDRLSVMWWGRAIEHLPMPVLERELQRHLDFYERQDNELRN